MAPALKRVLHVRPRGLFGASVSMAPMPRRAHGVLALLLSLTGCVRMPDASTSPPRLGDNASVAAPGQNASAAEPDPRVAARALLKEAGEKREEGDLDGALAALQKVRALAPSAVALWGIADL